MNIFFYYDNFQASSDNRVGNMHWEQNMETIHKQQASF